MRAQGPTRSQCGQSLGMVGGGKEMSSERSAGVEVRDTVGREFHSSQGRCAPQECTLALNPSGQQSQRH